MSSSLFILSWLDNGFLEIADNVIWLCSVVEEICSSIMLGGIECIERTIDGELLVVDPKTIPLS